LLFLDEVVKLTLLLAKNYCKVSNMSTTFSVASAKKVKGVVTIDFGVSEGDTSKRDVEDVLRHVAGGMKMASRDAPEFGVVVIGEGEGHYTGVRVEMPYLAMEQFAERVQLLCPPGKAGSSVKLELCQGDSLVTDIEAAIRRAAALSGSERRAGDWHL
jgi:hypothetical protein